MARKRTAPARGSRRPAERPAERRREERRPAAPSSQKKAGGPQKKILGLKPWQAGLVALVFVIVLYVVWKRSQSAAANTTPATTSSTGNTSPLDSTGAVSGQPQQNQVPAPAPSVTYNVYPPAPTSGGGGTSISKTTAVTSTVTPASGVTTGLQPTATTGLQPTATAALGVAPLSAGSAGAAAGGYNTGARRAVQTYHPAAQHSRQVQARTATLSRWQLAHPKSVLAHDTNLSGFQKKRLQKLAAK